MKKRTYSDEELKVAVSKSRAYSQVLKNIGLVQSGGTQGSVKLHIERLNLDISHFSHQLWNKGKSLKIILPRPLVETVSLKRED